MKEIMEILGETGCCKLGDVCGCVEKKDKSGSSIFTDNLVEIKIGGQPMENKMNDTKWEVKIFKDKKDKKDKFECSYSEMLNEKLKFCDWVEGQKYSSFYQRNESSKGENEIKIHYVIDDKIYKFEAYRKKDDYNVAECGVKYRHFKGGVYELLEIAKGTEDDVDYAIYRSVNQPDKVYCRPLEMFLSPVPYPTRYCNKWRFERIS